MFTKKKLTIIVLALFALLSVISETRAQTATTFVTGLKSPIKIIYAQRQGYFLVSEAGSPGATNNGRISIVTNDGLVFPLLDGLPSGPAPPNNDPSGPSALWLDGNTLYIAISAGNVVLNGPAPGSEIPNPNPASPIFSSILKLDLPANPFGFITALNPDRALYQIQSTDHTRLANGETLSLGRRNRATLQLVANFPDFTPNPRPDVPNNVRPSNPFGLVGFGNKLYVADAAQNHIRTVSLANGQTEIFFSYPPRPNPLPGPPVVEAVPDSLRLFGNSLLVTFLTGFPFPPGVADVRRIDLESGAESQVIGGLRMAIDVLPVASGFCSLFYTLEFQSNPTVSASGRIQRFSSPGGQPTIVVSNLVSPTSMALHPPSGDLLVTEIFPGRITRISNIPQ
ncbi:MAG: ScyD/ScyE family protein [Pyrinomonadaceae bacterium]